MPCSLHLFNLWLCVSICVTTLKENILEFLPVANEVAGK